MSRLKLSIIVPVYNVELYIEKCLHSLENQDIEKEQFEILVVNDGTKDNSVSIIRDLQKVYPNIRLIEKENGGLSSSRNAGIKNAQGEYLWFVDSDDYIEANVLGVLLKKAYALDLDLLCFGHKEILDKDGTVQVYKLEESNDVIGNIEYLKKHQISISSCFSLAKRTLFIENNLFFTEGIFHEDYEFMLRFYKYCKRISFSSLTPYYYIVKSEGSITSRKDHLHYKKRLDSWIIIIQKLTTFFNAKNSIDEYNQHAQYWINVFKYHALSTLLMLPLQYSDKEIYYNRFLKEDCFPTGKTYQLNARRRLIYFVYTKPLLYKMLMKCHFLLRNR